MSRSRRKSPVITHQQRHSVYVKWAKRQASKAVRKTWCIPDGGSYKKLLSPYNICDFKYSAWWHNWYDKDDRRWHAK
jgi:hypothetical protein